MVPDVPDVPAVPTIEDIRAAAARLAGIAYRTPLVESALVNDRFGGRLLIKAESLQRTGSFKFRGAYNRISQLTAPERALGVVAYSSGNHAQGVALAARLLGVPATIVMPADAPPIKLANTRAYGAEVVLYDRDRESRENIGRQLGAERGLTLVPPFDDPSIIAGQGTVGLELAAQFEELDARPDLVLCNCGGGGLVAGISTALLDQLPELPIYSVEPAGFDDTARSLAGGARQANPPGTRSICDALLAPTPGELTFAINRRTLAGGLAVDDDEVMAAMRVACREFKLVLEPGGAAALAAALSGRVTLAGKTVAVVASGGNVEPGFFAEVLAAE